MLIAGGLGSGQQAGPAATILADFQVIGIHACTAAVVCVPLDGDGDGFAVSGDGDGGGGRDHISHDGKGYGDKVARAVGDGDGEREKARPLLKWDLKSNYICVWSLPLFG
jgi:hypothetical protein